MSSPHSEYDLPPASSRVKQSRLASFIFAIYLEKDKDMFPSLKGIHHIYLLGGTKCARVKVGVFKMDISSLWAIGIL